MKKNRPGKNTKVDLASIHLIGEAEENFYQLGLKDAETGKILHIDAMTLIKSNSPVFDKLLKLGAKEYLKRSLLQKPERFPLLKAYAEGMKIDFYDLALAMMAPELASSLAHWLKELTPKMPNFFPPKLMGCSSLFFRNSQNEMNHFRILDFPLKGSYDTNERTVLYELKNWPKIFSVSSAGFPYPSISLITEHGVSIALHQKFTKVFNLSGMPIFEYVLDFARNVKTVDDAIYYAQNHQSFTTWCLNVGFKNGEVLSLDVSGNEIEYIRNNIDNPETPFIYYNNKLLNQRIAQEEILPFGFKYYNDMREESALKKIQHLARLKEQNLLSSSAATRILTTPKHMLPAANNSKNLNHSIWSMDILTPSSLQIINFNLHTNQTLYLAGAAPKVFQENIYCIDNIFSHPVASWDNEKKNKDQKTDPEYQAALNEIMLAQKSLDYNELANGYHHLQMAIDHFHESRDQAGKYVVQFFFIALQFLHEDHQKVRSHLRDELQMLKGKLPNYLEDHRLLFIARLNRLLGQPADLEEDLITHHELKKIISKEEQIPLLIYHKTLQSMILLRLDLLDIIYLHSIS